MRVLSCGEGFAAQNSRVIVVGIGRCLRVDRVLVEWPSGRMTDSGVLEAGACLELVEVAKLR